MVKTKVIMKAVGLLSCALCVVVGCSAGYSWSTIKVDAHRTGVKPATADNTREAMGYVQDGTYYAPSGRVYSEGATPELARILIDAQPKMASLKQVIAHAPKAMSSHYPQSELSNFAVDCIMEGVEELTGRKVDVGIMNFGGIRCDIPQGDVLLDDIMSMFPFKNYLVYVQVDGKQLRRIFEDMASRKLQAVGGVEVVINGKTMESLKVGGEEVRDDKLYGIGSIDFLLNGGDKIHLGEGAVEVVRTGVLLRDCILKKVYALSETGLPLEYYLDNRVVIK